MDARQRTQLMHAVLDGEASADERHLLQRLVDADPAAAAEFAQWQRLFQGLAAVAPRHAPEGLVATVLADAHQPFAGSRVLGSSDLLSDAQASRPRRQTMKPESTQRKFIMSGSGNGSTGNRKYWIGGAVAAVAVVVVAQLGIGGYPKEGDVSGTIVPAERHRAAQPTAGDIKLGTSGSPGTSGGTIGAAAADQSAQSAAERSAQGAAEKAAMGSAEKAAMGSAEKAAMGSAEKAAMGSAEKAAQGSAEKAAQGAAERAAMGSAEKAAQGSAEKAAMGAAEKSAQGAAQKSTQAAAEKSAQVAAEKSTQAAAEKSAQVAAEKSAQVAAEKSAQAAAEKAAAKAAQGAAQK
jgi:hypothetical protein